MRHYESADALATSHFSHRALLGDFDARVASNHPSFAILLTRIAEIDERRLYLDEGYPSMKAFLVQRMKLPTESSAFKRLTAARAARKYPALLMALFSGRLHLRGVLTLAPYLTPANADELVAAASDKTCFELEVMLAQRFPRPDLPERLDVISAPIVVSVPATAVGPLAPGRVVATIPDHSVHGCAEPVALLAAPRVEAPRPKIVPLAPQKFGFQFTGAQVCHDRSPGPFTRLCRPTPHPGGGETRGARARSRPMHVRQRVRKALWGAAQARVRSHRGGGARWQGNG